MTKIQTIYSLKELHDLVENHHDKERLMIWFDIDLTLVHPDPENEEVDILIEKDVTKKLFSYILNNQICFSIVTARFYDIVCNAAKRDLNAIRENIVNTIFPFLEELGLNVDIYKDSKLDNTFHLIKNEKNKCVGLLYKGILFSGNKGETIKNYRREFGFDNSHPNTIFIDDHDTYLRSVVKHVPGCIVLRREIQ